MKKIWAWLENTKLGRAVEILLFFGFIVACMAPYMSYFLFNSSFYHTELWIRIAAVIIAGLMTWGVALLAGLLLFSFFYSIHSYIKDGPSESSPGWTGPM